jgi:hypothetical protein
MEFPMHWLIVLVVLAVFCGIALGVLFLAYYLGKKAGDQAGSIRGYKEGQQRDSQNSFFRIVPSKGASKKEIELLRRPRFIGKPPNSTFLLPRIA